MVCGFIVASPTGLVALIAAAHAADAGMAGVHVPPDTALLLRSFLDTPWAALLLKPNPYHARQLPVRGTGVECLGRQQALYRRRQSPACCRLALLLALLLPADATEAALPRP